MRHSAISLRGPQIFGSGVPRRHPFQRPGGSSELWFKRLAARGGVEFFLAFVRTSGANQRPTHCPSPPVRPFAFRGSCARTRS